MIDINSFIFGMMIMAVLIGIVKQISNITHYIIDVTNKNYIVITADKDGEKIVTKCTKNEYETKFVNGRSND